MQPLEVFEMSQRTKETLASPELFRQRMKDGESILDVFGFSTEAITGFYDAAVALMDEKRYKDASDAFYFLTVLVPNEPLFWLGTARSDWLEGNPTNALSSYLMAYGLQPMNTEVFLETLRCCVAVESLECAHQLIHQALELAASKPEDSEAEKLATAATTANAELISHENSRAQ